jgi:hypothetical protein
MVDTHSHESTDQPEADLLRMLDTAISQFMDARTIANVTLAAEVLDEIATILEPGFGEQIWDAIIFRTGFLGLLLDIPTEFRELSLVCATIRCLSHLLSYAHKREFLVISQIYELRTFTQFLLECACFFDNCPMPYLACLSRILTFHDPHQGAVFKRKTSLALMMPDSQGELFTIDTVGLQLLSCLRSFEDVNSATVMPPLPFFQVYLQWSLSEIRNNLASDLLCRVFDTVSSLVSHYPELSPALFSYPLQDIDEELHRTRSDVYSVLTQAIVTWMMSGAHADPADVPWAPGLFLYFGDPGRPDEGIPALEITEFILRSAFFDHLEFQDPEIWEVLLSTFEDDQYTRKTRVLSCVSALLRGLAGQSNLRIPPPIFDRLPGILNNFDGEGLGSDGGKLACDLFGWFASQGIDRFRSLGMGGPEADDLFPLELIHQTASDQGQGFEMPELFGQDYEPGSPETIPVAPGDQETTDGMTLLGDSLLFSPLPPHAPIGNEATEPFAPDTMFVKDLPPETSSVNEDDVERFLLELEARGVMNHPKCVGEIPRENLFDPWVLADMFGAETEQRLPINDTAAGLFIGSTMAGRDIDHHVTIDDEPAVPVMADEPFGGDIVQGAPIDDEATGSFGPHTMLVEDLPLEGPIVNEDDPETIFGPMRIILGSAGLSWIENWEDVNISAVSIDMIDI